MYSFILETHNIFRWIIMIWLLVIIINSYKALLFKSNWTKLQSNLNRFFVIGMDVQILLGFYLYFVLSPFTKIAFQNFGMAMKSPDLRFWTVEHIFMMLLAIAFAHIMKVKANKAKNDKAKFRITAIFSSLILLAFIFAIPWERGLSL